MTSQNNSDVEALRTENSNSSDQPKQTKKPGFAAVLHFFGGGIYAPDASVFDPIEFLLNVQEPSEQDRLTEKWRDNRLSELSFVGIVSALLAGVLTSTGSWPTILPNGKESPWMVRTAWYCGIILSLFSILTAADQTIRLHRLSSHQHGLINIRNLLAKNAQNHTHKRAGRRQPSRVQVYAWQMPVMFLTTAAICMIVGMFLHVWSATARIRPDQEDWWNDNSKVAVTFTIIGIISIMFFFFGQITLYAPDTERE
ncbi:hypothetical protein BCR34DRAFT_635325 [Clohesyomyces aquaticus]|uniref:Uncharacterized protein n=1 Tax=Clohesyomyces aquaticus TaxID=1231657 RepID=A0A1Y2A303_9PLEO|nr:hypothetical protein BCR34DRAFT_635325 [Clohesyomyces aquaticus]